MTGKPLSDATSNNGFTDWWTSPCCYADMRDIKPGVHRCPECGRRVACSIEHEPVCRAYLADEGDEE